MQKWGTINPWSGKGQDPEQRRETNEPTDVEVQAFRALEAVARLFDKSVRDLTEEEYRRAEAFVRETGGHVFDVEEVA